MSIGYSCLGWDFDVFTVLCTYLSRECASCKSLCILATMRGQLADE